MKSETNVRDHWRMLAVTDRRGDAGPAAVCQQRQHMSPIAIPIAATARVTSAKTAPKQEGSVFGTSEMTIQNGLIS